MEQLTARQLAEWVAYDKMDPIGEQRADFRTSYLAMVIKNMFIWAYGKKGSQMTKIEDHSFNWDFEDKEEQEQQSVGSMKEFLLSFASAQNKRVQKTTKDTKK